jgi:hypothetical protein
VSFVFRDFRAIIRRWHNQERLSTIIVMLIGLLILAARFYFDLQIIVQYLEGKSWQLIWIALWHCAKYLAIQRVYWCIVPIIVLSIYWATWVADLFNFFNTVIQKVAVKFDTRQTTRQKKVMAQSSRTNIIHSHAVPPSPQVGAPNLVTPTVTTSTALPARMTIDFISDIPAIYHPSTISAHTFNTILQPLTKEPKSQVREKHVLTPNPKSVEILYQPREYYVIAANYPFDKRGLETRTLKLESLTYSCVTLTEPKDQDVVEWLRQNRPFFIGGQSRAAYNGSSNRLPLFGRYVPRTLYLRSHLVKPYLTQLELEKLPSERITINDKKLNYYALVVDSYDTIF